MSVRFMKDYAGHLTLGVPFKQGDEGTFYEYVEALLVQKGIAEYALVVDAPPPPELKKVTRTYQRRRTTNG